MKPCTKEEIKAAKRIVYRHAYSLSYILFHRPLTVDRRTRIGKAALKLFNEISPGIDKAAIKELKKQRAALKTNVITNFLNLPIVRDYRNNKRNLKGIYNDRLSFYGRNHWAKNERDLRILEVLKRYYMCKGAGKKINAA